jgi:membrane protein required for colicin V production
MNVFDIIITVFIIWSAYKGYTKGFLHQIATLIALLLGIWGALNFSDLVAVWLHDKFKWTSQYMELIAFIITFLMIVIGIHLISKAMEKTLEAIALGFTNRLAGLFFGVLKTAFILSIVILLLNKIDSKYNILPEEQVENSRLIEPLSKLAPVLFPILEDGWENFQNHRKKNNETKI